MSQVALCRMMQWTWTELLDQPQWFIDMLMGLLQEETRIRNKK